MVKSFSNPVRSALKGAGIWLAEKMLAGSVEGGALPLLYAATAAGVTGGQYIGLDGKRQLNGNPTAVEPVAQAGSPATGAALWLLTAELTGVTPDPSQVAAITGANKAR
jgi:hypothetical protein